MRAELVNILRRASKYEHVESVLSDTDTWRVSVERLVIDGDGFPLLISHILEEFKIVFDVFVGSGEVQSEDSSVLLLGSSWSWHDIDSLVIHSDSRRRVSWGGHLLDIEPLRLHYIKHFTLSCGFLGSLLASKRANKPFIDENHRHVVSGNSHTIKLGHFEVVVYPHDTAVWHQLLLLNQSTDSEDLSTVELH